MTQPTTYVPGFNFGDNQASDPNRPVPGDKIDVELLRVKRTLDEFAANLAKIQRDDTALANRSVGFDQLKTEIEVGINPPAPWSSATTYVARDGVFIDNKFYICEVSHVSGVFATDLAAGKWYVAADFTVIATAAIEVAQLAADWAEKATEPDGIGTKSSKTWAGLAAADRAQTGLDVVATAADRVQTGLDVVATAADVVQTGLDAVATAADVVQTGLDAVATAADRVQTGIDRTGTTADKAAAAASVVSAAAARDAALLSTGLYASTAQGIGIGVRSIAITAAGTGGTNGTRPWVTSGGTAVIGATGTVTIAGGAVVAVNVAQHGQYTVAPTGITITGAGALTGFTYAMTNAVNTAVNSYFSVPVSGSNVAANLYRVGAGPVATLVTTYASSQGLADVQAVSDAMFGSLDLWRWVEAAGAGLHIRRYRSLTTVNTSAYRFVLHAKAGTRKRIGLYSNVGVVFSASFDLELRTAVLHSGTAVLTVTYLANGTVECVVETTATSAATTNIQIYMLDASNLPGTPRVGDGASTMYPHSLRAWKDGVELWPTDSGAFATAPWTGSSITMTEHAAQYLGVLGALTPPEASTLLLAGVKVDIIGNSLAAGLWPASFASLTGADVSVHATGGAALGVDGRGSPHYGSGVMMTHLTTDTRADAKIILIDMDVNSIAASDVPLGTIADTTNATEAGAMAQANAWVKANRPNAKLIFVVPTAAASTFATSDYRHGFANANGNFVEDFQVMTRRMANILGRPAIDPNAFGIGFADTENTSDGLHWDASGALKIAKIYAAELTRLVEAGWLDD